MVRPEETPLSNSTAFLRHDLLDIAKAGIAGASGPRLVTRALGIAEIAAALKGRSVTLIAAGKVAAPMASAFLNHWSDPVRSGLVAGTTGGEDIGALEWQCVGHPVPDDASVIAGRRALALAGQITGDGLLVVLLSGGASAALAVPAPGLTLAEKVGATRALLHGGVAIDGVNCVRKHLSAIKGGWLAAATTGSVMTLVISDVVDPVPDDPAVIGSGPTAPDPTDFAAALQVADRSAVRSAFPPAARRVLERGRLGEFPETPKPGDVRLRRSRVHVIGNRVDAVQAAVGAAASRGYHVVTLAEPIVGEARVAGDAHVRAVAKRVRDMPRPVCIVSAGETTVHVTGSGRGGRNQEFALGAVSALGELFDVAVLASVGTDGVDGPTDAAGAIVDTTTLARAGARGLSTPDRYLQSNDSYTYFAALDELVRFSPTETNVGDLQIMLVR